jgi:integrase
VARTQIFVCGYITGIRKGELTDIQWPQVDFESDIIALEPDETKNRGGRSVPILKGDMRDLLVEAKRERDEKWPDSTWVFNQEGEKIIDFRIFWENACNAAGVPEL